MKLLSKVFIISSIFLGVNQLSAQQANSNKKTKAMVQLEQMLTNLNSHGLPKSRPQPIVINESNPRFKTLNELHPSFRKHLDPQLRPAENARVIPIADKPTSSLEQKRNSQLQAIIKRKQ